MWKFRGDKHEIATTPSPKFKSYLPLTPVFEFLWEAVGAWIANRRGK